ncbi:uncharacterized protein LOC111615026 [Centruroides sculpturatus]|uniref:uncharacterized protein LOC111615021 n=1 Tax=Centruroides sculpturatus TaxID=218467 RepID=UPI000C6DAB94|nr:uncharacterized protein LOC111615021 [Centruroides sculpturatus]XP_023212167.1 uncharacterized protein LOC111615026 [Centruroides sculpturatus]
MLYKEDIIIVLITVLFIKLFNGDSLNDKVMFSTSVSLFVISMTVITKYVQEFNTLETHRIILLIIVAMITSWILELIRLLRRKIFNVEDWNLSRHLNCCLLFIESIFLSSILRLADSYVVEYLKGKDYETESDDTSLLKYCSRDHAQDSLIDVLWYSED